MLCFAMLCCVCHALLCCITPACCAEQVVPDQAAWPWLTQVLNNFSSQQGPTFDVPFLLCS